MQDDHGPAPDPAARAAGSITGHRVLGVAVGVVAGRGAVVGRVILDDLVTVTGATVTPAGPGLPVPAAAAAGTGAGGGRSSRPERGQRPTGTHWHPAGAAAGEHARRVSPGRADQ